jgi:hypothetical protein
MVLHGAVALPTGTRTLKVGRFLLNLHASLPSSVKILDLRGYMVFGPRRFAVVMELPNICRFNGHLQWVEPRVICQLARRSRRTHLGAARHVLSFLHVFRLGVLTVVAYRDHAEGVMEEIAPVKYAVTNVVLHPQIEWIGEAPEKAKPGHMPHEAHEACFIVNSAKTKVTVAYHFPNEDSSIRRACGG